jgi:hypothetical protein
VRAHHFIRGCKTAVEKERGSACQALDEPPSKHGNKSRMAAGWRSRTHVPLPPPLALAVALGAAAAARREWRNGVSRGEECDGCGAAGVCARPNRTRTRIASSRRGTAVLEMRRTTQPRASYQARRKESGLTTACGCACAAACMLVQPAVSGDGGFRRGARARAAATRRTGTRYLRRVGGFGCAHEVAVVRQVTVQGVGCGGGARHASDRLCVRRSARRPGAMAVRIRTQPQRAPTPGAQ